MTTTARIVGLSLALLLAAPGQAGAQGARTGGRADPLDVLERTLSPSGDWLTVAPYGRVWRPDAAEVGAGFVPYATGGQWVYTNYGWSFEARWDWSWVVFHYGRWVDDAAQGWAWVPGDVWGPAWVDWRVGRDYVGWAPLPPGAAVVENESIPWSFVQTANFASPDLFQHVVAQPEVRWVYRVTQPERVAIARGSAQWWAGPPVGRIARAAHIQIRAARVVPPVTGRLERVRVPGRVQPPTPVPVVAPPPSAAAGEEPTPHVWARRRWAPARR